MDLNFDSGKPFLGAERYELLLENILKGLGISQEEFDRIKSVDKDRNLIGEDKL